MLRPSRAWILTLAATSTMAVSYVDRQALAVLAPTITARLHIGEAAFGWLGSVFSLAYLVYAPLAGRFIDRVGARTGLLGSVLLWSAVAGMHALVPGLWTLAALRICLGAAEAPSFPAAAQTVSRVLPAASRSAGFGVLFTGSSIGAAAAAVLVPALEHRFGWRLALLFTALVGLAWVPMWLAVTASADARAVMSVREESSERPFSWPALLRDPAVLRAILAVVASAPINGFVLQWGAKLLVARHAVLQQDVGHYLWLPPILFDAGAIGFGWLARGTSAAPRRGLFLSATLLLCTIGALGLGPGPWATTLVAGLAIAGGGGVYALTTSDMLSRVLPDRVAAASSVTASAQSLALILLFPAIGVVLQETHSYLLVGLGLMLWAIPGTLAWLLWDPRR
jgi:ACS family hexuronate transporter-like MFS transporter